MGRFPNNSIIHASHTTTLSEKWGRRIRNTIAEHSTTLGIRLSDDSKAAGRWALAQGGEYYAVGVGVGIAGFRADLGIIDDALGSREDADSDTIRGKIIEWFPADFSSRLKPGAKRVVMATRWREDDLTGWIIEEAKKGKYRIRVVMIPAIAGYDDPVGRRPGEYLWDDPDGYNYGGFLRQRQNEESARNWSALYQQSPSPDEGLYFKREQFRYYTELPKHLRYYGASDYAVTAKGGDYTVHAVIGVDPMDNLYVVDIWRQQTESDLWVDAFCDLLLKYKPLNWAEEQGQIIKSLGPFITKRMHERRSYSAREQFTSVSDKPTRARSFQARVAMGKVYFPSHAPWMAALEAELLSFPAGVNDDQVDALGLAGRLLDKMVGGRVPDEIKPDNTKDYGSYARTEVDESRVV
jgi:predicted phage terminase large subunit-like protein